MGDINKVKEFARTNMPSKPFHNYSHVRRVAEEAAAMGENDELLRVAAYLHDIGHRKGSEGHEKRSAELAKKKLPEWGYSQVETVDVANAIEDTPLFETPSTRMGKVLSDADTHNFSFPFDKFKSISLQVKKEEAPGSTREEWWKSVIDLLENHKYHGPGKQRYAEQKKMNLEQLRIEVEY